MFPLNFKKKRAEYFLDCLANGKPISHDPEQPGWTINEMVQLAGACFFVMMTHGPILQVEYAKMQGKKYAQPANKEHAEAVDESVFNDLHAGIEFAGHLSQLVCDAEYDQTWEDFVQCAVTQSCATEIKKSMQPFTGLKEQDGK